MRPCGVVNTVGGTRITDRHLLPERTTSLAGLSGTREDFNRFFLCDASLSSFSFLFFFFFGSKKKQRGTEREKKNERGVLSRGIQIRRAIFISYFSARLIAARVSPFDKCCAFLDALYN